MEDEIQCFIHIGGVVVRQPEGKVGYEGWRTKLLHFNCSNSFSDIMTAVCGKMKVTTTSHTLHFTTKDELDILIDLEDDGDVEQMLRSNDNKIHLYLLPRHDERVPISSPIETRTNVVGLNACQVNPSSVGSNMNMNSTTIPSSSQSIMQLSSNDIGSNERQLLLTQGFIRSSVDGQQQPLQSARWSNIIVGSSQTFPSAKEFRDAVYLMSLAGRFKYYFKRNSPGDMTVVCKVDGCPWKITCRAAGNCKVVQVHTFHNQHNHTLHDVAYITPDIKAKHETAVIDQIIRGTPEYLPRQICKDFLREYGVNMTYYQAWNMKEKAKNRIFGEPKHNYSLLPWLCEKICMQNPNTRCTLTHEEGRFKQFFLAHHFCIHGFQMGCRPVIAIDSSHMSGSYRGSLLAATAYDADDGMFPLAIGIVSSENYEDWSWFLQHLKDVIGAMDVVIISDRHPALLTAVPEIFGGENHAYCYRHLKENFSSFASKKNCKGRKGKRTALDILDSIAYARLDHDYITALNEMTLLNPELAAWVEENNPEHWAISKFPRKRWDKMSTQLAESVNSWLRIERHHSICSFIIEHMHKMVGLLNRHKEEVSKWRNDVIGPRTSKTLQENITRSATYEVIEFFQGNYMVCSGRINLQVNLVDHSCTCKAWDQNGIPCEHACAAILKMHKNPLEFMDDYYGFMKQAMIYSGSFIPIETHDMPSICPDGVVRDVKGNVVFSLKPPTLKRPPGRPRKKRIESQFQDKALSLCSLCRQPGHNRKTCKNPSVDLV